MRGPIRGFRLHLITAVVFVAFAAGFLLLLLSAGGGLPSLSSPYRVKAVVPTAASLASNARVTMAGVEVGRVASVELRGRGALVELEIEDESVTPIPANSRVAIRQRTPLGENYVAITPGSSDSTLPSGGVLAASRADEYVEVDQILSVLRERTRERARELIQGLGGALAGRGERLNALVGGTAGALEAGGSVAEVLARDREHVSRLIEQLGDISRAIGDRGEAIRTLARDGLVTFRAIADRDDALRATLDRLPSTLDWVRSTTDTLGSVTRRAAPVLADLAAAVRELRPSVELLRPAAEEGRGVVEELGAAAPSLEQTLARLRGLSSPTARALPEVGNTLCELNPALRYLEPYTPDLVRAIVGLGSASNPYDAVGHVIKVAGIVNERALTGLPPQMHEAVRTLIRAGALQETRVLGYDPYPPPNSIGATPDGEGVLGPTEVTKKFPRIHADC